MFHVRQLAGHYEAEFLTVDSVVGSIFWPFDFAGEQTLNRVYVEINFTSLPCATAPLQVTLWGMMI